MIDNWLFVRTRKQKVIAMTFLPLMNQDLHAKTILPLPPSFLLPPSLTIRNTNWGKKCYRVRVETRIGGKLLRRTRLELDCLRKLVFGISIGTQSTKSNSFVKRYREEEKPWSLHLK